MRLSVSGASVAAKQIRIARVLRPHGSIIRPRKRTAVKMYLKQFARLGQPEKCLSSEGAHLDFADVVSRVQALGPGSSSGTVLIVFTPAN
ncbi:hypothetical protein EVAR_38577_1 [Eumeta japonica]|uniref:Uncharacterized protein n=1 Tax=Eumeta variegata TaxID=151549 RepID=A0A4C1WTX2_EUMVA|nr:hypothetical protein EVAR_38577_1 [Eumeta japonica]